MKGGRRKEARRGSGKSVTSPLHIILCRGHVTVVRLLLSRGARVEAEDTSGKTPLHWAAARGQVVKLHGYMTDV